MLGSTCPSERSEESPSAAEILRFAEDDGRPHSEQFLRGFLTPERSPSYISVDQRSLAVEKN